MAPRSLEELRSVYLKLRDQLAHMPDVRSIGLADNRIVVVVDPKSDLSEIQPIDGIPIILVKNGDRVRTPDESRAVKRRRRRK